MKHKLSEYIAGGIIALGIFQVILNWKHGFLPLFAPCLIIALGLTLFVLFRKK